MARRTVSPTLSHVYETYDEAVQAVYRLEQCAVPAADISLVGSLSDRRVSRAVMLDPAENPVRLGAAIGATAGGGVGLLAGLGSIMIPGFGPLVASGWFLAALTGAVIGMVLGGLIGLLVNVVLNKQAHAAAEGIQQGGIVVVVRGQQARADELNRVLREDYRAEAERFARASPIIDTGEETATNPSAGDYSDEMLRIQREQERIQNG